MLIWILIAFAIGVIVGIVLTVKSESQSKQTIPITITATDKRPMRMKIRQGYKPVPEGRAKPEKPPRRPPRGIVMNMREGSKKGGLNQFPTMPRPAIPPKPCPYRNNNG